jgi:hypothetical protein
LRRVGSGSTTVQSLIVRFVFLGLLLAGSSFPITAQEALRVSLAGQDAAEARRRALSEGKFQVKMGPVSLRFTGRASAEATDNVRGSDSNPESDLILRPQVDTLAVWRVTDRNSLTFGLGIGYAKYLRTTEYDHLFITPDSDISFDLYVRDFAINFHDRFDYTSDVSADPTISGTGSLNRFENTAGVRVLWDLNKAIVSLGYDHHILRATESQFSYLDRSAELFSGGAGFQINPTFLLGLEYGGGLTDFNENILQDNQHFAVGPYARVQLTDYTSMRASAGYVRYFLDTAGRTNAPSGTSAIYFDLSLRQRPGPKLTHTLAIGRRVQAGIQSDLLDLWYANYSADLLLLRKTSLATSLSFEHASLPGTQQETLDRYGFGLSLGRPITRHTSASLSYQLYFKDSDVENRGYLQNRLVLEVRYTF